MYDFFYLKKGAKCMICGYYHFKDKCDYQPYVRNDCQDFSMTVMNLSNSFILNI